MTLNIGLIGYDATPPNSVLGSEIWMRPASPNAPSMPVTGRAPTSF